MAAVTPSSSLSTYWWVTASSWSSIRRSRSRRSYHPKKSKRSNTSTNLQRAAKMDISVIRDTIQKFRPFTLTMNDGREFEIRHPDWIFVNSGHVTIVDELNRRLIILEPILIASLSVEDPA